MGTQLMPVSNFILFLVALVATAMILPQQFFGAYLTSGLALVLAIASIYAIKREGFIPQGSWLKLTRHWALFAVTILLAVIELAKYSSSFQSALPTWLNAQLVVLVAVIGMIVSVIDLLN